MPAQGHDRDGRGPAGDVFFEFTQLGGQVRVAAIDAATSTEVVIIAPLTATRRQMQDLALAKLRRRIEEQGGAAEGRLF
jgi:hypothetical protein